MKPRNRARNETTTTGWPPALLPDRLNDIDHATPFLIVDCAVIEHRYRELTGLLPSLSVFYAMKCNSSDGVLSTLAGLGAGFEIASVYELEQVLAIGTAPQRVLFSNTVKPAQHIESAFSHGVTRFACDSEAEVHKLAAHAPGSSVYVRLTVDDHRSLFPLSRKFGTSVDEACRLLVLAGSLGLVPYGLMFHVGSQCTDPLAWRSAIARCSVVMRELERHDIRLEMLNLGGGLPARYVDPVPSARDVFAVVERALQQLPYQPELLCAEPGRFLVAESAVLASTVIGIENRGSDRWVHLDVGGYNGLMEALQTGGRWRFPLMTSRADHGDVPQIACTVTGPSCDSSDTTFYGAGLPATLEIGDRVYIGSTGAYTLSYASHFNGFPPPATLFINAATFAAGR